MFLIYEKELQKYLKKKKYILIGSSTKWEEHKNYLENNFNINILEYENSETILLERV